MGDQATSGEKKRVKPGILRLDISKPRRSSGGSVEFRPQVELLGEVSPSSSTSPPHLSVTWASECDVEGANSPEPRPMQENSKSPQEKPSRAPTAEENPNELSPNPTSPVPEGNNSGEEDYSVSVSAIMQRRASIRGHRKKGRGSRRASSAIDILEAGLYGGDRRRSSVFTTSSGDTAISVEDGTNQGSTQEQIYENIRLHKEVIQSVKHQPWSIRRKVKLVRQAKTYIARHEGALQERFAMSRNTKDLWARCKIVVAGRWKYLKREIASYLTVLIPWELRIKQIESHFGSGVASYFTFLRWLLWVNIMMAIPLCAFVIIPELLASDHQTTEDRRKRMTKGELKTAGNILKIWEFEGYLKYSPLFYGYYSHFSGAVRWGYDMPLAYFLTTVAVYMYSFFATLKKMAQNSRLEKLSSKDDECVFSWKLFTGWDFMIGHAETAHNRIASVVVGFKEALLEEAEKKKDKRNWKVIVLRILVNIVVVAMLAASGYCIVIAVDRSENVPPNSSWLRRNEVNVIMTSLSFFLPMIFECFGLFENWHPRQQLRLQLARIMILNLLNLYSLMFGFIYQITAKDESQQLLKNIVKDAKINRTHYEDLLKIAEKKLMDAESPMTDDWFTPTPSECTIIYKNCSNTGSNLTTTLLLLTTMLPGVWNRIDPTADVALPNYEEIDKMHDNDSYFDYYDYFDTYVDNAPSPGGAAARSIRDVSRRQLPSQITGISPSEIVDYKKPAVVDAILDRNSRNVPDTSSSKANEMSEQGDVYGRQKQLSLTEMLSGNSLELTKNATANSSSDEEQNQIETFEFFGDRFQQLVGNTTTAVTDYYDTDNSTATTPDDGGNCTIEICLEDLTTPMYEPTTTPKDTTELREAIAIYQESIRNATEIINDSLLNLSKVCWETTLGQELSKVIVFDTLMSIALPLIIDFFRALFVRYVNHHWCWDMEKTFPQYGDFKIAESILNLVYNQGQVWMGIFFSPGLVIINLVKLVMLMYLRSWIVLTCNVPHELVFKASKSNNFYLSLLLTMLFLCVLPVGFAIVWLSPSTHCGPFSKYTRVSEYFTTRIKNALPDSLHKPMEYITSSSTVIPLLLLLILIIYYLISLTGALREANQDLRNQLQKERMEERKKMLSVPDEKTDEQEGNGISSRWKKVLDASSPVTPTGPNDSPLTMDDSKTLARKEMLSRIMKHALRKGSETSDDLHGIEDDETDNEHDPLPHDGDTGKRVHKTPKVMKKTARKPSILDIVQMAKKESAKEPHPKGRFKINREVADAVDNEAEAKIKAVSERRKSLLKRQAKVSENLGYTDDPNSNYEVVNEKNKEVEKRQSTGLEPDVFKYDTRSMQEEKTEKEVQEQRKRARSDVFPKTPTDPSSSSNGSKFSTLTKGGRKKLGSFLALVKEAVNTKKIETEQEAKEDSNPEDQRKDSLDKVLTKTEETTSEGTTDTRRDSESDRPKRNDSQGSIWSDNIPVITISKTEGQEMILECSDIEADNYKSLETHDDN